MKSLNGQLATLSADPENPQTATKMEQTVDAKLAPYRGNSNVEQIAEASKEHSRKDILEWAEKAKRNTD